jgi:multidrug efflux system membrane fusion protein
MTLLIRNQASLIFQRIAIGFLVVTVFFLFGCSDSKGSKKTGGERAHKAVPVSIGRSETKAVPLELRAVGTVEPYATVAIKSQITGVVQSIHFKEGEAVKQGQLLFTIDPRPFVALLDQAQGALARDKAELDNARTELTRYSQAAEKGYVSTEQADQARTKEATLLATVKADQAAVENARLQLDFCSITSPINGYTGELLADRGNLIKANADTAMVTINQIRPIKVSFSVPGKNLAEIKTYLHEGSLKVEVILPGEKVLPGTFSFLDNTVDPTTGTIRLKAEFPNTDTSLWPGQFVEVHLILTVRPNAVVVPTAAVQVGQNGAHIYVVKSDMTVEDRHVTTGTIVDGETVVESGIKPGEQVVTDGQLQLTDGVRIVKRPSPIPGETSEADQGTEQSRSTP